MIMPHLQHLQRLTFAGGAILPHHLLSGVEQGVAPVEIHLPHHHPLLGGGGGEALQAVGLRRCGRRWSK